MKCRISTLAFALLGLAAGASAQTVISADVTADATWSGEVVLASPIFVRGATLTILPGTLVRGQPRSSAVVPGSTAGTPGTLIVTQSGRLIADGSASNPIIMTTAAIDNDNDGVADDDDENGFEDAWVAGDVFLDDTPKTAPLAPLAKNGTSNVALWGGLVILGNAPTNNANKAGVGYGKATIEGLTVPGFPPADAAYGGILPHDSSGVLRYVSIRHAGDEIGSGNELNGISLGGVGDGTILENIEVYANFDDGVEWFGGTVNGRNLAVFFVGDDMFDLDEGYTGVNQFLFGIMPFFNENSGTAYGSASGDKAGEFDGDNYRPDNVALNDNVSTRIDVALGAVDPDGTPSPLSNPSFYNMTIIGSTPDGGQQFNPVSPASTNRGIQFRNGFAGQVFNSIVVNTGGETGVEVDTGATGAPGFDAIDNANGDLIRVVASTLADGTGLAAQEQTVIDNGDLAVADGQYLGGSANVVNGGFAGLANEDATFNPTGNAAGKLVAALKGTPINPRPTGAVGVDGGVVPTAPGLDRAATYRGAFDRTAPELWTTGWTVLSIGGLLAD
jgi:hypothetical protein